MSLVGMTGMGMGYGLTPDSLNLGSMMDVNPGLASVGADIVPSGYGGGLQPQDILTLLASLNPPVPGHG